MNIDHRSSIEQGTPTPTSAEKKSVKHLECAYYFSQGGCKFLEKDCLCAGGVHSRAARRERSGRHTDGGQVIRALLPVLKSPVMIAPQPRSYQQPAFINMVIMKQELGQEAPKVVEPGRKSAAGFQICYEY